MENHAKYGDTIFYHDDKSLYVNLSTRDCPISRAPDILRHAFMGRGREELEPVVWAIDDWNRNYKLGLIFECAVGDGKLLVSASAAKAITSAKTLEAHEEELNAEGAEGFAKVRREDFLCVPLRNP